MKERKPCSVIGCDGFVRERGMCNAHVTRVRRHGHPGSPVVRRIIRGDDVARFWSRVDKRDGGCWLWRRAGKASTTYGFFQIGGRDGQQIYAHRYAYQLLVGPIPDGLELDHLCRNPPCVNPAHLEPVTRAENQRRGMGPYGINARKTHCIRGHPFDETNTIVDRHGWRRCRECHRAAARGGSALLSPEQRSALARAASLVRWSRARAGVPPTVGAAR